MLQSPAAPDLNPLARLFPPARATISSPLPPDEVWRRLGLPDEQEWQIGEGVLPATARRYKVRSRPGGRILDIDGPYGYKKARLVTEAAVRAAGAGTSLELTSWMNSMQVLLITAGLIIAPFLVRFSLFVVPLVLLVIFYGAFLFNLKFEARLIKDYCARRLAEE
ncbi:MAG TPA: hypothetical protein VD886_04305 [Herpetosiphonaceae bacterium]|nr:hypothetical protein [Herpetosiphonaceae bacterium]